MKKQLVALASGVLLFGMAGLAQAGLTTIGTAQIGGGGPEYNLIWDDDNNGNSIIWLDYSNAASWAAQQAWAAGLEAGGLTINLKPGYTVDWGGSSWRLPTTVDGPWAYGVDGTTTGGYNITSSEMGHLYYTELGNLGYFDTSWNVQAGYGLQNTGDFENFIASWYWSGTEYATNMDGAWLFSMGDGFQYGVGDKRYGNYGLAVRSGQVSAVPVPGAIWLLGAGLSGLVGLRRRRKGNRV